MNRHRAPAAMTLVELLMVLVLLGILTGLALPRVNSLFDGYRVRKGAATLFHHFQTARQEAIARGVVTEVRFFERNGRWIAVQSFVSSASGDPAAADALLPLEQLPDGVVMEGANATTSPLLSSAPAGGSVMSTRLGDLNWRGIRFSPAGTAGPLVGGPLPDTPGEPTRQVALTLVNNFVTLLPERDTGSNPYTNDSGRAIIFTTLQITPATGRLTLYQP